MNFLEEQRARERKARAERNGTQEQHGDAYEGPLPSGAAEGPKAKPGPKFALLSSSAFAAADYRREWLVRRLLVRGQPAVVGGPRKALKTSFLVDLALSLGTGTPVLGEFAVPRPARVALLSGESGEGTLQETARRVAAAKGIDLAAADVLWGFALPQLADTIHLAALQETLETAAAEVLLLDPLYLALLAGTDRHGPQAGNVYQMGPLLMGVAQACLRVGCTPVLAHHFRLQRADQYGEPQLEDLAYSGIQEFARQWALLGRRERYQPGTGSHQLWLSVGGSAGHSGLWALTINEGVTGEDFTGRRWEVSVSTATEARAEVQRQRDDSQRRQRSEKDAEDESAVARRLDAADPEGNGVGLRYLTDNSGIPRARAERAVQRLIEQRIVEEVRVNVAIGSKATRNVSGVRRIPE